MKLLFGLLVSLAISSAFALPAHLPKDEVDVVEVPRGPKKSQESDVTDDYDTDVDPDYRHFKGVVDTGAGYPFLAPMPQPFSFNLGFFDSFQDIFRRLSTRLWSVGSGENSEEGGFSIGLDPTKGANTTSVVKVYDGHKVEINETIYSNGDGENGGAVIKFRIINIRPVDDEQPEVSTDGTEAPTTDNQNTPKTRDIEGKSDEDKTSDEEVKPDDNEINANIDDPESTTEAITTEMIDTVPHRIPSSDNNAIDNDNPVNPDELQVDNDKSDSLDVDIDATTTEAVVESLDDNNDDDDVATLADDITNPAGNTMKSEKLSALVDLENVNDGSEDTEQSTKPNENDESDGDDNNDESEFNESIVENRNSEDIEAFEEVLEQRQKLQEVLAGKQMQELVENVGEKLSMADDVEERFADEVEKMLSADIEDKDTAVVQQQQQQQQQSEQLEGHHSLREDISSSDDDEDDAEDVNNVSNQGLNSEWGSLDDKNILTNEIDVYQSVPIDLSNDIAINDIMADQGAPVNPDAEIFDLHALTQTGRRSEVLKDIK